MFCIAQVTIFTYIVLLFIYADNFPLQYDIVILVYFKTK